MHLGRTGIALAALAVSFSALSTIDVTSAHAQQQPGGPLPPPPPPASSPGTFAPPVAPPDAPAASAPSAPIPPGPPAPPAAPPPAPPAPHAASGAGPDVDPISPATTFAPTEAPVSGYYNGNFFLRSKDDLFRLYVQGRVHVDSNNYFGPGLSSLGPADALKSGITLRRARLELGGEVYRLFQWQLGAEFGASSIDNVGGNTATRSSAVDGTSSLQTFSDKQSPVEAPSVKPIPTDAFVNFSPSNFANIQVGQFYVPFTWENRVSDNTTPFLEKGLVTRNIGTPYTRDIGAMFWGELPDRLVRYDIGIFNGDGQNRPNSDSRYDLDAKLAVKPFVTGDSIVKDAIIGLSGRYGSRDKKYVGYDVNSFTTQGGYAFWKPTYKDSLNRTLHILPSGDQTAFGADINIPISIVDITSEFVYTHSNTREAVDGFQLSPFTERFGTLKGVGYYAQVGVWVLGSRDVIGQLGYVKPVHLDLSKPQSTANNGLEILAKIEQLSLTYDGASRSGTSDKTNANGDIKATVLTLGANYWATRHLRISINYGFNSFSGSEPVSATTTGGPVQTSDQRAVAPAQLLAKGADNDARDNGHILHEVQARVGVQF